MMLTSHMLNHVPSIRHGFFTRQGGVSEGIFGSLNCGFGSGDSLESVFANRQRIAKILGAKHENLCSLYQVHGREVITITRPWSQQEAPKADGMVSRTPGIMMGILTADCAPVLLADAEAGVVGAAHAGWKGAQAGIIEAVVESMCAQGAKKANIIAAIGPTIAIPSYEVGEEYRKAFLEKDSDAAEYFRENNGSVRFDLPGYAGMRLRRAGISQIDTLGVDTYADETRFFSYRRATHRSEKDYGRQISAIMLAA